MDSLPLPARQRSGSYRRWELGAATPAEVERAAPDAAPPAPDPVELAREVARAEGVEQGLAEGRAAGQAEYAATLERIEASLVEIGQLRGVLAEAYRREVVELALATAEALVQREIAEGHDAITGLVEQAITVLGADAALRLNVAQSDRAGLESWLEAQKLPALTIEVDPALAAGDLRLESPAGSVESSMRRRIARVRQLVLGELEGEA